MERKRYFSIKWWNNDEITYLNDVESIEVTRNNKILVVGWCQQLDMTYEKVKHVIDPSEYHIETVFNHMHTLYEFER